jgi:hypothetical protein
LEAGGLGLAFQTGLFGFQDEGAAFVKVDAAGGGGTVGQEVLHHSFEDIIIVFRGGAGGVRDGKTERAAEFGEEHAVVGAFLAALAALPAGDEGFDRGGVVSHAGSV